MPSVLITGASRGFGRELLASFAAHEWTLFPLVRKQADAEQIAADFGSRCHPIIADVSAEAAGAAISAVLQEHTASLDLLINNAGHIRKNRNLAGATTNDLLDHFNVHCCGVLRCVNAALPFLRQAENPLVINVSSRRGSISWVLAYPGPTVYAYQIAKCAQNMLTALLDKELKEDNIRVFAIHPGQLRTDVAPSDADCEPGEAAVKLYQLIAGVDRNAGCRCYDISSGATIEW